MANYICLSISDNEQSMVSDVTTLRYEVSKNQSNKNTKLQGKFKDRKSYNNCQNLTSLKLSTNGKQLLYS